MLPCFYIKLIKANMTKMGHASEISNGGDCLQEDGLSAHRRSGVGKDEGGFKRHVRHVKLHCNRGSNQKFELLCKSGSCVFNTECQFDLVP
jgi:hypothetical protein